MSLKDRTPASVAGIKFPFHNWKNITEQPYGITARIPIMPYLLRMPRPTPKISQKQKVRISQKAPGVTSPIPSLSQVRRSNNATQ
jgi:hypothetical protein